MERKICSNDVTWTSGSVTDNSSHERVVAVIWNSEESSKLNVSGDAFTGYHWRTSSGSGQSGYGVEYM